MRAVIQRVKEARVEVRGNTVGKIGKGLLVFLGVKEGDTEQDVRYMVQKIPELRIFPDEKDTMNLSCVDIGGEILVVSQFTLWGDVRKGRRPSFTRAARPERAKEVYEMVVEGLKLRGLKVETGIFQEMMEVFIVNDGPVTILLDSEKSF
ncbi:MAG: D-aminoacyl-tRNA deacylase [Desulfatiglandales bacterium]